MQSATEDRRAQRRKDAIRGAVTTTVIRLGLAVLLLWLLASTERSGVSAALLLVLTVYNLGTIIPMWMSLKTRLKEIEGGEEDAAAQY